MNTEYSLQSLMLIMRGLEQYKKHLYEEIERQTDIEE